MAGKTPFFLTGGSARILLNNKAVAYATDVSYRISVKHAAPRVLGRFEVEVVQPLSYEVSGTLSIIRYGRGLKDHFAERAPDSVSNEGNSIGSYSLSSDIARQALGLTTNGLSDGATNENFDPSRMFQSKMFNIEIRQRVPGEKNDVPVVVIRDCRFEDLQFNLNKRGVATLSMTFIARYVDDDTFIARKSGSGQEFS